jgi:cell surface protein SprA
MVKNPIKNAMYGLDVNYRKEVPRLTKILDKLPYYSTVAPSTINAYAEGALYNLAMHHKLAKAHQVLFILTILKVVSQASICVFLLSAGNLASTPQNATDANGNILFPEATLNNDINYGKKRAKLAWYQIEPALQNYKGANNPIGR